MDLVDAFIHIGLTDEAADGVASDDAIGAARAREASAPLAEHLHRYYIVSRGSKAPSSQAD
jgi:hypothetical protein